jgi:CheY-like chemotaxis protein
MDPVLAGLLGMVIIAAITILVIIIQPEATTDFIRGITKFKWGLKGVEIERDVNAVAQKHNTPPPEVRTALSTVPLTGRVLWVDDHPENNVAEMDLLRRRGVLIDVAATNAGAIQLAQWRSYNLVISDIGRNNNEPAKAGLELPGELDKALEGNRPFVIFYTSSSQDTGIPRTTATVSPVDLFQEIGRQLRPPS